MEIQVFGFIRGCRDLPILSLNVVSQRGEPGRNENKSSVLYNKQWWSVGQHLLLRDSGRYVILFMNVNVVIEVHGT
jgi:hypothetical protein